MCTLYAEQLYTFVLKEGKNFADDKAIIKDQVTVNNETVVKERQLIDFVNRFESEIVPTLTEAYLIAKCQQLSNG